MIIIDCVVRNAIVENSLSSLTAWLIIMTGLGSFMIPHHNLGLWGLLPGLRFGFLNSNKFDVIAIDCVIEILLLRFLVKFECLVNLDRTWEFHDSTT